MAARCREAAQRKARRPKLRSGATVVFAEAITFSDGAVHDRLTAVIDPRRPRAVCFRPAAGGGLYRVSRLSSREFRIEG